MQTLHELGELVVRQDVCAVALSEVELDPVTSRVVRQVRVLGDTRACSPVEVERYAVGADIFLVDLLELVKVDGAAPVSGETKT